MDTLPSINIGPLTGADRLARRDAAASLGKACHDVGFMVVHGHGIPAETISGVRAAVIEFFDQPLEAKLALSITRDNYRGYIPLGFFTPNSGSGDSDQYEGYKLHNEIGATDPIRDACDLYGPNRWPNHPAGFRSAVLEYWQQCDRVSGVLLDALAEVLGIRERIFRRAFDKSLTNMTLLHYPPQSPGRSAAGIHPHKDTDALTILAPDPAGGLYVKCKGNAEWISADAPDDALIVNIGDMLEIWSGGYLVSTPHKVVNPENRHRYSFPYFAVPRFDVRVAPLRPAQAGFDRAEIHVGEASRGIWRSNWPDAAPVDENYDPATP